MRNRRTGKGREATERVVVWSPSRRNVEMVDRSLQQRAQHAEKSNPDERPERRERNERHGSAAERDTLNAERARTVLVVALPRRMYRKPSYESPACANMSVDRIKVDRDQGDAQQRALLGMLVRIRGDMPRAKPAAPCRSQMMRAASPMPRAFLIAASSDEPRVCNSVLHTSNGVVTAAATAPAIPPAQT